MFGYKTLHMYVTKDIAKLSEFVKNNPICNVYRKYRYPIVGVPANEECIAENSKVSFNLGELKMADRAVSFNTWGSSDIKVFLGKDVIIEMPTGYKGNSIFYRIAKV